MRAAAAPTTPEHTDRSQRQPRLTGREEPDADRARWPSTMAIPPISAILSLSPKVVIANDLSHSGVRSMNVLPTASNGEAEG